MFYILNDQETILNITPEINYGNRTVTFKRGFFLFDQDSFQGDVTIEPNIWIKIESIPYRIDQNLVFKNKIKAQIYFLKIKLNELENNGYKFFLPNTYKKIELEFNKLSEKYPEYLI